MKFLKIVILIFLVNFINFNAFSEQSAEDIIKKRKSLFSENYKTAKRADILSKDHYFLKILKRVLVHNLYQAYGRIKMNLML